MALLVTIGGDGTLFVGEDKILELEVLDPQGLPIDIGGMVILFDVRKADAASTAILSRTAVIIGAYSPVRASNTQRAQVVLTDTELNTVKAIKYRHSWKRMDDGSETVIAWGDFTPQKATAP